MAVRAAFVHALPMSDDDTKTPAQDDETIDAARTEESEPSEELRKAFDHLGKAALSFRDRYLSDDKVNAATERARVGAEHLADDAEKALRKAGGSLDVLAVDAEKSVGKVAEEAEKALREAQKAAAPALRAGLAKLSSLLEGKSDPIPEEPAQDTEKPKASTTDE